MFHLKPSRMVYYLTLHSCAYIGIVGTLRIMRRSASAKEQLHYPRGKHGREDERRRSCRAYSIRTSNVPLDVRHSIAPGRPTSTGRPTHPQPAAAKPRAVRRPMRHRTFDESQRSDERHRPDERRHMSRAKMSEVRRPLDIWTPASDMTSDPDRTSDSACA